MSTPLRSVRVRTDVTRVLVVTAHPDDVDFGAAGTVATWTAAGIEVAYCICTSGDAGGFDATPRHEMAPLREAEQRAAAKEVGVSEVRFLGHSDGRLTPGLELRRDISREIRRYQPDVVLGVGFDVVTPYGFDQADHRAAGLATLDAIRDAGNRWVFPEQIEDEGLAPHAVRWYIVRGHAGSATHGVEVTGEPLRRGVASLEAHAAYLAALPDHPAPEDIIPSFTAVGGKAMGVEHAVLFRAHDLQAPVDFSAETGQT